MKNFDLFEKAKKIGEPIIDKYYPALLDKLIIPSSRNVENKLLKSNNRLMEIFDYFEKKLEFDLEYINSEDAKTYINEVITILKVVGMNFSPFSQFFMVCNVSYSQFLNLNLDSKIAFLSYVIPLYLSKRHKLYNIYSYSNIIFQIMNDNYSHKRKSKLGIEKIIRQLNEINDFSQITSIDELYDDLNQKYFLPDKGGTQIFNQLLDSFDIRFEFSRSAQNKLPDVVFFVKNEIIIMEHKSIKEGGGGQDKQIRELIDFIGYSEKNSNVHYISYLDGDYFNKFSFDSSPKIRKQNHDIQKNLRENNKNYFVNTNTFKMLVLDMLE